MDILVPLFTFVPLGLLLVSLLTKDFPSEERSWLLSLLSAGYLLRIALATLFVAFPELRVFHEDATGTEIGAQMLATYWRGEGPPFREIAQNWGFLYLSAGVYFLFGRYQVNASYFSALLGTILILLVYRFAKRMFHDVVARRAALLVGLMPSVVLWGSMALKDVPVTLCIVLSLSSCLALKQRVSMGAILGTALPLLAIQAMRFYMVYFVIFAIFVALVFDRSARYLTGVYRQLFLLGAVAGLFVMLGLADRAESDASLVFNLEYVSQYRRGMAASANSGFARDVDISEPGMALAYLPVGLAHLLFAPFPWQMTSLRPLIAAPETILWWTMFPATVRGIVFSVRHRFEQTSPLLIFAVTLTAVYSLMQGNVGTAFRQRAQILIFLFVFNALGTYVKRARDADVPEQKLLRTEPA